MGKDGSGEPAAKKLKQSQLCFSKSSGSLKSKLSAPSAGQTLCELQKVDLSVESKENKDTVEKSAVTDCCKPPNDTVCQQIVVSDSCDDVETSWNQSQQTACDDAMSKVPLSPLQEKNSLSPLRSGLSQNNDAKINPSKFEKEPTDKNNVDQSDKTQNVIKPVKCCTSSHEMGCDKNTSVPKHEADIGCDNAAKMDAGCVSSESGKCGTSADACDDTHLKQDTSVDLTMEVDRSDDDCTADTCEPDSNNSLPKADESVLNESVSPSESVVNLSSDTEGEGAITSSGSTPVTPKNDCSRFKRKMTPKMMKRHEESVKKKEMLMKMKEEKQALRLKRKSEKMQQKMEEEEKRKVLQQESKKKRLAELELKNEEKRIKQEDKRMRREREEEDKKKKKELKAEEQRKEEMKKEYEERKRERAQAVFASFFKKQATAVSATGLSAAGPLPAWDMSATDVVSAPSCSSEDRLIFMPFPVKADMRLAEVCRRNLSDCEKAYLESAIDCDKMNSTYLEILKKNAAYKPGSSPATWPPPASQELHDCIIIEAQVEDCNQENDMTADSGSDQVKSRPRAKLLQFIENRRPAYFGTWTKRSDDVTPRRPFTKDGKGLLDYEVDSDSEWEEEEEGEDLENIKEDDNEGQEEVVEDGENGYILDNTFVPHGYLSDEEQPEQDELLESVEEQKDRLVALREEFNEEMKQGAAQALKPKLLGCLWVSNSTTQVSKGSLYEVLLGHRAVWKECDGSIDMEPETIASSEKSPVVTPTSSKFPLFVLQEIANMVHGSRWSLSKLVREVGAMLNMARPQNSFSARALSRAIKQMAARTLDSDENSVWSIKPECRVEYKLQDLEDLSAGVSTHSKVKNQVTLLDSFVQGHKTSMLAAAEAKKHISLTPVLQIPTVASTNKVADTDVRPEASTTKKKVAFVTLPPRTPSDAGRKKNTPATPGVGLKRDSVTPDTPASYPTIEVKAHVDTPRPLINRFLKESPVSISQDLKVPDDSDL